MLSTSRQYDPMTIVSLVHQLLSTVVRTTTFAHDDDTIWDAVQSFAFRFTDCFSSSSSSSLWLLLTTAADSYHPSSSPHDMHNTKRHVIHSFIQTAKTDRVHRRLHPSAFGQVSLFATAAMAWIAPATLSIFGWFIDRFDIESSLGLVLSSRHRASHLTLLLLHWHYASWFRHLLVTVFN